MTDKIIDMQFNVIGGVPIAGVHSEKVVRATIKLCMEQYASEKAPIKCRCGGEIFIEI